MTDVLLEQVNDGGEITIDDSGSIVLTDDLRTSVYISMFGGGNWWADLSETDSDLKLRGETGRLINELPPTGANLIRLEQAITRDLQWLVNIGAATSVTAEAALASIDRLTITVFLEYDGTQTDLKYSLNWTV